MGESKETLSQSRQLPLKKMVFPSSRDGSILRHLKRIVEECSKTEITEFMLSLKTSILYEVKPVLEVIERCRLMSPEVGLPKFSRYTRLL